MTTPAEVRAQLAQLATAAHSVAEEAAVVASMADDALLAFDDMDDGGPPPEPALPTIDIQDPGAVTVGATVRVQARFTTDPSLSYGSISLSAGSGTFTAVGTPTAGVASWDWRGFASGDWALNAVLNDTAGQVVTDAQIVHASKPPDPPSGLPLPSGGDDTAALQAYLDSGPAAVIQFDPSQTYRCDRELRLQGQTIIQAHIQAGPEGAGIGGAHPYRNIYIWNCPPGSSATLRGCVGVGRNTGGGTADAAYDAEREAQHFINAEGVKSLVVEDCSASQIWGDGLFCGPGSGNIPCRNVTVDGLDISATGRQGVALTGIDGGTFRRLVLHNMRRSCVDIEPLLPTFGLVANVLFEDCDFGPGRLLVMAGKGGGPNVSNVTWRRCKNIPATGTPILQLGASDYVAGVARRGPFLMEDCTWDIGGSPAAGFELTGVTSMTFRRVTAKFPASRTMTAVRLKDSVGIVIEDCDFPGAATRVSGDPTSTWTDDGGGTTPPPPVADPTIALSIPATGAPGAFPAAGAVTCDPSRTVASVEFRVDGVLAATDTTAPYAASLQLDTGTRTVTATVTDSAGKKAVDSKSVVVASGPTPPPTSWEDGTDGAAPAGSKMTVAGVACTYGGRRWIIINDTSSAGNSYKKSGYTILQANLSGADTDLAASQAAYVQAIEACVVQWKVNSLGFFVGHSSYAATVAKSLRGEGDPVQAQKLIDHLRGFGQSGVGWRTDTGTGYEKGGNPEPWKAKATFKRHWMFTGIAHQPMNRHTTSADGHMAMVLPEAWHWRATKAGLIATPYSQVLQRPEMKPEPNTTYHYVDPMLNHRFTLEALGNDAVVSMDIAAVPDGHTLVPTTMNGPAAFWRVMEMDAGGGGGGGTAAVVLTSPPAGNLSQPFNFGASVTEAPGSPTATVEYLADGAVAADVDVPPPPFVKPAKVTLVPGTHALQARQKDAVGKVTLSPVVTVTVATPPIPTPPTGGLVVARRADGLYELRTDDGRRWNGNGDNTYMDSYNSPGDMTPVSNWEIANADRLAAEMAALHMNWVRVPTNNDTSAGYIARLKKWTDALASKGIRSMLCPFGVTWAPSKANGDLVAAQWSALGKAPHLVIETVNEPNRIDNATWLAGNRAEITAIRGAGYRQPIFVGCQNWCWTIPVPEAQALVAQDAQLVFMHHRYAFDGSTIRGASDASAFVSEWKAAAQAGLCIAVGEYGWYNAGGNASSIPTWCQAMADAIVGGITQGWLAGALAWMWLWDQNSHITGNSGGDWWDISQGEPYGLNAWGKVAQSAWTRIAAA